MVVPNEPNLTHNYFPCLAPVHLYRLGFQSEYSKNIPVLEQFKFIHSLIMESD